MASESPWPAEACPVCLQSLDDARVLPCLHVVCRVCVDQLVVTASGGNVTCPVCRSSACLPPSGAACLPKDAAFALGSCIDKESLECRMCDADKTDKAPAVTWCKQCRQAFCQEHAVPHILSASSGGEVHHIMPLKMASVELEKGAVRSSAATKVPVCSVHRQALRFHCGDCNAIICGDCSTVGDHQNHGNIRYVRDVLAAKKTAVTQKVDTLDNDVICKLERALRSVDGVSAELIRRSDEVLGEVRQTGGQVVQMVEAHIQQMEQEVTDMRDYRCKVLDRQRDELKSHLDAARNAVRFKEGIADLQVEEEAEFSLLLALEARATSLTTLHIKEEPESHSRLMFRAIASEDLACKTKESIGKVIPCQASAKHSEIDGCVTRTATLGSQVIVTLQAKDCHGDQLNTGGDIVTASCAASPSEDATLSATVTDNNNGSYSIACSSESPTTGEFQLEVYVNGEKMTQDVGIKFAQFAFDNSQRHSYITLNGDSRKATYSNGNSSWVSVLGSSPMQHGQHSWKMKVGSYASSGYYMLGLGYKPMSSFQNDHSSVAYCWQLNSSVYYRDTTQCPQGRISSFDNDTFKFDLNCEQHTLQITNVRSGQVSTFTNLPAREYFPYVCMYQAGQFVEFVE